METETMGIGHNSELSPDQAQALAYHHKGKYEAGLAAKKKTDAEFKNTCKRAIADGVSVDDIKLLIQLDTPEGEAEMRAELNRRIEVARWAGSEIGTQFSLLDEPDRTPLVERAAAEGKRAGMKGESLNNPYDGAAGQAYAENWHLGQEALFSVQGLSEAREAAEEAGEGDGGGAAEPVAPRPRGRPKLSDEEKAARRTAKKSGNGHAAEAEPADEHAADKARDAEAFEGDPFPATA